MEGICNVCGQELPVTRLTCTVFGEQNTPEEYEWFVCDLCKPDFISRTPRVFIEHK